jgi:hypothetical protein
MKKRYILLFNYNKPNFNINPYWYNNVLSEQKKINLQSVEKCIYNNQEVYYFQQGCCDIPQPVYDISGKEICSLGGKLGTNPNCPDFYIKKYNCQIIWKK